MSVKNRIKGILKHENITIVAFEKMINASNGYVNSISKGIGVDKLQLIIERFPNWNIDWLLTGKGTMYKLKLDIHKDIFEKKLLNTQEKLIEQLIKRNEELEKRIIELDLLINELKKTRKSTYCYENIDKKDTNTELKKKEEEIEKL